jgi:hypothetical protein
LIFKEIESVQYLDNPGETPGGARFLGARGDASTVLSTDFVDKESA